MTVYEDVGQPSYETRAELPPQPGPLVLDRLHRETIGHAECRYAVVRDAGRIYALYLPERQVPRAAVRALSRRRVEGRWLTSVVRLGDWGGGRAVMGPELFFRQVDLGQNHAWLAPLLMRFALELDVKAYPFEGATQIYGWTHEGERFYYAATGSRWALYGAGNTPPEYLARELASHPPKTAEDYLWAIGAIRLF